MKKVLIADDKDTSRLLIRTVLEQAGHAVYEASNGREAVSGAGEFLPDLIVLDLQMPEMDGLEALKQLRSDERFAATPIAALTASAMRGDREAALEAGFTAYITKPVCLVALRKQIETLLP